MQSPSRSAEYIAAYRKQLGPCIVDGCVNRAHQRAAGGKVYCGMHYDRLRRWGHTGPAERINKPRNNRNRAGYVVRWIEGKRVLEHRWVVEQALGRPLRKNESIHHKNGVKDDNRLENLEVWVSQPKGQRPEDIAEWVVQQYPELVRAALNGEPLRLF